MKIRKALCISLSVILITCVPWSYVSAAVPTEPIDVEAGYHNVTVDDVYVENYPYAVRVTADQEGEDKDASATIKADVTLNSSDVQSELNAVYAKGTKDRASVTVKGNIHAIGDRAINGALAEGNGDGTADISVGGTVSVKNDISNARGIELINGDKITVNGSVTAEANNTAECVHVNSICESTVTVKDSIYASGLFPTGARLETAGADSNVSFIAGNGIRSVSNRDGGFASGLIMTNQGGQISADVKGDVAATSASGSATAMQILRWDDTGLSRQDRNSIQIHGNVISDGIGVYINNNDTPAITDVLVENEIRAEGVGVMTRIVPDPIDDSSAANRINLTVWKIQLNGDANAAEYELRSGTYSDVVESRGRDQVMEKRIMYITKVEQPDEGGTLQAVDADGNALPTSFGYPVAHEGDKVVLKADLETDWMIKAAYNGQGEGKQQLSKDQNGDYYLIVPKGGGIYLYADLEKKPDPVPPPAQTEKAAGTLLAKMTSKGKNSMAISWNKVDGAEGYDIFFAHCGNDDEKQPVELVKTITGNSTFKWTKSSLSKSNSYKAVVKAYVTKNGKKSYIKTSPVVHAYSSGGTKNYTNARSVSVKKSKVSLKKGKTHKIKASVKKLRKGKRLLKHTPKLRYLSSDPAVAKVSKKGKVTAKGKGSCVIYVYAHNGVSKKVKVTVK